MRMQHVFMQWKRFDRLSSVVDDKNVFIVQEYNSETRQMETWHRFGCAHLDLEQEPGNEASYLTVREGLK